jgi:gamma-glutamyl-gamma-aminobutyrate hydrolase PuuD
VEIDYDTDVSSLISTIDGWYIPGGADIDPSNYGQELHP